MNELLTAYIYYQDETVAECFENTFDDWDCVEYESYYDLSQVYMILQRFNLELISEDYQYPENISGPGY